MTPPHNNRFAMNVTKLMVGGSLIAAVIMAVHYGWSKGSDTALSVAFVIALVVVAFGEVLSWHSVAASWYERRAGACLFWAILGISLSAGTLYTNFSTAAGSGEKVAVVKTADYNTYDAIKSDLASNKAKLARLESRLSWMTGTAVQGKPVGTIEGADAKIKNAKAHKWWKTTNECTETKGPQTREFCANYAAAEEEKNLAIEKKQIEADVASLRKAIAADNGKMTEKVALSDDAANITAVAAWFKVDTKTARQADSMLLGFLVQAMMLLGGVLLATETYRHIPRKPWFSGRFINWAMSLYHRMRGTMNVHATNTTAHVHHDVFGKALGGVARAS